MDRKTDAEVMADVVRNGHFAQLHLVPIPGPFRDICVGINSTEEAVFVNCKDPNPSNATDFVFLGLRTPRNMDNPLGSKVMLAFVDEFSRINTIGVSNPRIDLAPGGLNPPHTHPLVSEILFVKEGTLFVTFVTSDHLRNRLFTKVLYSGDLFVLLIGLNHSQLNVRKNNAVAIVAFSSQNLGVITIANAVV